MQDLPIPTRTGHARQKLGLPPGSLVFTGQRKVAESVSTLIEYDADSLEERPLDLAELARYRDDPRSTWVNVDGLHDVELVQAIGKTFSVHPLVLEDILNPNQRPKFESSDDYLFISAKMLRVSDQTLHIEQVSMIVGPTWLLSFQEQPGDVFEPVRERLRQSRGQARFQDAAYLAYALIDVLVDNYFVVLEHLGDQVEALETEVLNDPDPALQRDIRRLHREMIAVRKAVWPVREVVTQFERAEAPFLSAELKPFLRDLYDHTVQTIDLVESLRDLLAGLRDSYQTAIGNRMNEVMKLLTIVGTIFIPLTFLAGVYGMNFERMPELHYRFGYPISLVAMVLIAVGLLIYFRRKDWL